MSSRNARGRDFKDDVNITAKLSIHIVSTFSCDLNVLKDTNKAK